MTKTFEAKKNRKALVYTVLICGVLLLMFILISWKVLPPAPVVVQDLLEINLGNNDEGFGEKQPLIKGERSPEKETAPLPIPAVAKPEEEEKVKSEENAPDDAAPLTKIIKKTLPVKAAKLSPATIVTPSPKPQKPKLVYTGPGKGTGNNATQDNGYTMQGNNKTGKGDYGDPKGDKDSYGNTPVGKIGGPKVISGNRKVIRYYSFTGDLPKATVNAIIRVSPAGAGTFTGFGKGSTSNSRSYADAITGYLRNMQFDKAADESIVTVQFNFNVQ